MQILVIVLQIVAFCVLPYYLAKASRKLKVDKLLSDVVICFLFGILLGNTKQYWLPEPSLYQPMFVVAENASTISVLLGVPMLLFIADMTEWMKYTGKLLISFLICIVCVIGSALLMAYLFPDIEGVAKVAGMLTGTYIGGTPNMVAISQALEAPTELFILVNSSDIFCSGLYFLFITSFAQRIFGLVLPQFKSLKTAEEVEELSIYDQSFPPEKLNKETIDPLIIATGVSIAVIGLSVGLGMLFQDSAGKMNQVVVLLGLTSISVGFSFIKKIRNLKGVYEFAQYLLLIFGVAAGFMADFGQVIAKGGDILLFTACFVACLVLAHFLLAAVFRIDVDTFIVTAAACIYGPPFIGQTCAALKNREILAAGMALATIGLAMGNYMGVFVASLAGG